MKTNIPLYIMLILCIILFTVLMYNLATIKARTPYGYYDGEYICVLAGDHYEHAGNKTLMHETCHYLVEEDYVHFCTTEEDIGLFK